MIGVGNEVDPDALERSRTAGLRHLDNFGDLESAFAEVQATIEDDTNSFYWLNYASPRRGDFSRMLPEFLIAADAPPC